MCTYRLPFRDHPLTLTRHLSPSDIAVVEMTDAFRQPSLFYHLGVRESFSMANNIILYCDTNSDSLQSLQVSCRGGHQPALSTLTHQANNHCCSRGWWLKAIFRRRQGLQGIDRKCNLATAAHKGCDNLMEGSALITLLELGRQQQTCLVVSGHTIWILREARFSVRAVLTVLSMVLNGSFFRSGFPYVEFSRFKLCQSCACAFVRLRRKNCFV